MTHYDIHHMCREKLIRKIESAMRCCCCSTATKRNREKGIRTHKLDISNFMDNIVLQWARAVFKWLLTTTRQLVLIDSDQSIPALLLN